MNWQADFAKWQQFSHRVRCISDRTQRMMDRDARETARKAGLDPQMPYLHAHNALVSLHQGKPWGEVNYPLARRVQWLEQRQWHVSRLAERVILRAYNSIAKPHGAALYTVEP